uniref:Uncharacterized protein n=1 Tax=Arundo donax TaxID=35708 RepID=A0A0A9EGJ0_ARUDO
MVLGQGSAPVVKITENRIGPWCQCTRVSSRSFASDSSELLTNKWEHRRNI